MRPIWRLLMAIGLHKVRSTPNEHWSTCAMETCWWVLLIADRLAITARFRGPGIIGGICLVYIFAVPVAIQVETLRGCLATIVHKSCART